MKLKALYLPVDKPLEHNCKAINVDGKITEYNEYFDENTTTLKRAELFIVQEEYNERKILGRPDASAMKWLKNDMELAHWQVICDGVKVEDQNVPKLVFVESVGAVPVCKVRCPTCGKE